MTHITEPRVIGNHADMGTTSARTDEPQKDSAQVQTDVHRAASPVSRGSLRRLRRRLKAEALARWDSEGGAPAGGAADDMSETS